MKILFVSSGNSLTGLSPIIYNQGESIRLNGIDIDYYTIKGRGIRGYLKNIFQLYKFLKFNKFDIIHAHYSLSAFVASFAGAKPLIVSLMGSDVKKCVFYKIIIRIFNLAFSWKGLIVKSQDMKLNLDMDDAIIIPNGVNLDHFKPASKAFCQEELNWNKDKKHILFAANPARPEKNFQLSQAALELLNETEIELHFLINVSPIQMPLWYNAFDVILLSSLWEGSPNVIKEAMACNRPIVATNVGDIEWLFGSLPGHYLSDFDVDNFKQATELALDYSKNFNSTSGRDRIISLGLDSETIAKQIIAIYTQ